MQPEEEKIGKITEKGLEGLQWRDFSLRGERAKEQKSTLVTSVPF
jgi:hypothetical protein